MTLKKIYQEDLGKDWKKKLSPRLVRLVKKIDSINRGMKPVSAKFIREALS